MLGNRGAHLQMSTFDWFPEQTRHSVISNPCLYFSSIYLYIHRNWNQNGIKLLWISDNVKALPASDRACPDWPDLRDINSLGNHGCGSLWWTGLAGSGCTTVGLVGGLMAVFLLVS